MLNLGIKPGDSPYHQCEGDGAALDFLGSGFTACFSALLALYALNSLGRCEWAR